jgi:hypothetical protein
VGLPYWAAGFEERSALLPAFLRRITPGAGASGEVLLDRAFAVGLALTLPPAEDAEDAVAQAAALRAGQLVPYAMSLRPAWGEALLEHLERKLGRGGERCPPVDPLGERWTTVVFLGFVAGLLQDWAADGRSSPTRTGQGPVPSPGGSR